MEPLSDSPAIEVLINNARLPPELYAGLLDVSVQDDMEAPSAVALSFVAWDDVRLDVSRVDDKRFDMGSEIEVRLGYKNPLTVVSNTEIVSTELELSNDQTPRFSVRGYDRRYRLKRGTANPPFTRMKDSDIAMQIAYKHKLSPDVMDSVIVRESVTQYGKNDLDFLRERAALIGYELKIDGRTLSFRPISQTNTKPLVLAADKDLTQLSAFVKDVDQVDAVEVRGWDAKEKVAITSTYPSTGGVSAERRMLQLLDHGITSQQEADKAARSAFEARSRRGMGISGSCLGRTDLRAGLKIQLVGIGQRFSGLYRLISVTHKFSSKSGFSTSFSGERSLT